MKNFAKLATAAMSISALALVATSADAQSRRNRDRAPAAEAPATPPVSREFATAYQALAAQLGTSSWSAADGLLPGLKALAANPYEQYLAARADYSIATGLDNVQRRAAAATAMVNTNAIPAAEQPQIYALAARLAYTVDDYSNAASRAKRAMELGSSDTGLQDLAIDSYFRGGQLEQGLAEGRAVIAADTAAGRLPSQFVFNALARALQEADRSAEVLDVVVARVDAYPTPDNYRIAALYFLEVTQRDVEEEVSRGLSIDALRLLGETNSMLERRFYVEYVSAVAADALPNEVLTAAAAGRQANLVPQGDSYFDDLIQTATDNLRNDRASLAGSERNARTRPEARFAVRVANAYYSYGDFAKAEEMLTLALTKADADTGLINLRLGQARYKQGNAAGALEALAAVTGARTPLAKLWIAHIRSTMAPAAPAAAEPAPAAPAAGQ
jgi:hypothetical protein